MNKINEDSNGSTRLARTFTERNNQSPQGFADRCYYINQAVLSNEITPGQAICALKGLQIELNLAAAEMVYQQLEKESKLQWRIPLLDRAAQPKE